MQWEQRMKSLRIGLRSDRIGAILASADDLVRPHRMHVSFADGPGRGDDHFVLAGRAFDLLRPIGVGRAVLSRHQAASLLRNGDPPLGQLIRNNPSFMGLYLGVHEAASRTTRSSFRTGRHPQAEDGRPSLHARELWRRRGFHDRRTQRRTSALSAAIAREGNRRGLRLSGAWLHPVRASGGIRLAEKARTIGVAGMSLARSTRRKCRV
jgi:hypothetical protein